LGCGGRIRAVGSQGTGHGDFSNNYGDRYRVVLRDSTRAAALFPARHMTGLRALAIGLGVYAVYLPVAMLALRDYSQAPRLAGEVLEMILKFEIDKPDRYVARSYIFSPARFPDASQISIYEGVTPLPREKIQFTADGLAYVIRIKASDGSDPRTNGRQYWIVK
jgi:hypothetical protein